MSEHLAEKIFFYLALILTIAVIWPFKISFLFGVLFAYITEDYLKFLMSKIEFLHNHKFLTSGLFIFVILALILVPIGFLAYSAVLELVNIMHQLNISFDQRITGANWLAEKLQAYGFPIGGREILARVNGALLGASQTLAQYAGAVIAAIPNLTVELMLVILSWYFFLVEGKRLRSIFLVHLIPWKRIRTILKINTKAVIKGLVVSSIIISFIQAMITIIILGLSGIPNFLAWGFITFFCSFIPLFGTLPVFLGAAIYCFTNSMVSSGIAVSIGAVIIGTIDNILRPFLMKTSLPLNFFWLLLSIIGGIAQFGVAGAILGPLVFSLTSALFHNKTEKTPQSQLKFT